MATCQKRLTTLFCNLCREIFLLAALFCWRFLARYLHGCSILLAARQIIFSRFLVLGIAAWLGTQTLINIGAMIGLFPKGDYAAVRLAMAAPVWCLSRRLWAWCIKCLSYTVLRVSNERAAGMTIVLTGGGSGGHITPILAVAAELKKQLPDARLVYIGQRGDRLKRHPAADPSIDAVYSVSAGKFRRYKSDGIKQILTLRRKP